MSTLSRACLLATLVGLWEVVLVSGQVRPSCNVEPGQLARREGALAVFTCRCVGVVQGYDWSRGDGRAFEPGRHAQYEEASGAGLLVLYSVTPADAGVITCRGRSAGGVGQDSTSLTVQPSTPVSEPVQVSITPSSLERKVGGTAVLVCAATPSGVGLRYAWSRQGQGQRLPAGRHIVLNSGSRLFLYNLQAQDGGRYACAVTTPSASTTSASASVYVAGGVRPTQPPQEPETDLLTPAPTPAPTRRPPPPPVRTQPPPPVSGGNLQVSVVPTSTIRRPGGASFMVCNARVPPGYAVRSVNWARSNGAPTPFARSKLYTCNSVLYMHNLTSADTGFYTCRVEAADASGRRISSQGTSNVRVVDWQVTVTPSFITRSPGESTQFDCRASGGVGAVVSYEWKRMTKGIPRFASAQGSRLAFNSLRQEDTGEYCCHATIGGETTQSCAEILVGDGCIKNGEFMAKGTYRYFNTSEIVKAAQVRPAADIIVIVDESRSMIREHAWLQDISLGLDEALRANGIGLDIPNQFGLIGFAKDDPDHVRGRSFPMSTCEGGLMGTPQEFNIARQKLALDGRVEDLYHAMDLALDTYPLRPGQACQIIGITDEGRTPQQPFISYPSILRKMREKGCMLNVVVNQKFMSAHTDPPSPALGVSASNDSAVEVAVGNYRIYSQLGRPVVQTAHGSTHVDYTLLAFELGGAAWDLNRLRDGGSTALSFTKAFINLKVREISRQLCERCFCDLSARPDCRDGCVSEAPVVSITGAKTVQHSQSVELVCLAVAGDPIPELIWQPPTSDPSARLPPRATTSVRGDFIEMRVSNVQADFCVECNGTNFESTHSELHCVTVLQEQPKVVIMASNRQQAVEYGTSVMLQCDIVSGIPDPVLAWTNQPAGSSMRSDGRSIFLTIPSFTADTCVQCVGTSAVGQATAEECIKVQEVQPEVMISGSHQGADRVIIGTAVELRCIVLRGIPKPTISWGSARPAVATISASGDAIVMNIPALLERTCIECVGQSPIGRGVDQVCIDVTQELPRVTISGTNNGRPIIIGQRVTLRCVVAGGIPDPQISWGSNLPRNAVTSRSGNAIVVTVTNVLERTCVTCVGTSLAGEGIAEECVDVEGIKPIVAISGSNNRQPVVIGTGIRLECTATTGIPRPQLSFGNNLPTGATVTRNPATGNLVLNVPDIRARACFTCVGTNVAGDDSTEECVDVLSEQPTVQISGSNNGQPVVIGQGVILRCTPTGGVPFPTVAWGSSVPSNAVRSQDGTAVVLALSDIRRRTCISCIGTSLSGTGSAEECIEVTSVAPVVTVNGSHRGQPINIGTPVVLECRSVAGIPRPALTWANIPSLAREGRRGSSITATVDSLLQRQCFSCVGNSLAGTHTDEECVDVMSSEPQIQLTGTNNGRPVIYGSNVQLRCEPTGGIPFPEVSWGTLPRGVFSSSDGNALVVSLSDLKADTCVRCLGNSLGGSKSEEICIEVLSEQPVVGISGTNNGDPVVRGDSVTLTCTATSGIPSPILDWQVVGGGRLPSTATTQRSSDQISVTFSSFDSDICVRCVGTNVIGSGNDEECLKVDEEIPVVRVSGSNQGLPVNPGDGVLLECEPTRGFPEPNVEWRSTDGQPLPTTVTRVGNKLVLEVTNIQRDFCAICDGANAAGQVNEEICVKVKPQAPTIRLSGSNKGLPLNEMGIVDLICIPTSGIPAPTITFRGVNGAQLPSGAVVRDFGNGSKLTINGVSRYSCVECLGVNSEGSVVERLCLDVLSTCPHPSTEGERIFHGQSARNYSTVQGPDLVRVPAAAVIALVVDESGSMVGEHQWLRTTVEVLEENLVLRGIGVNRPNQYALVGFGHKDDQDAGRERGKVLMGATGCGTVGDLRRALDSMYVDGRLEDGYSAVATALDRIPCLQQPRPQSTACQVILATDEGRDILTPWVFRTILEHLRRFDCVLNVVVKEQMRGRATPSSDWQQALGVSQSTGAVVARDNDQFVIVPHGQAFKDSGQEDTHEAYVELAAATGGAAWDLSMLRTERYRQSFTKGFIEVKIQEIERQIVGICEDCVCRNGTADCSRLSRNFGESACLNPAPNRNLGITANPDSLLLEPGEKAEFACDAGQSQAAIVTWYPQTAQTLVQGNRLILTNVTASRDQGEYTCRVTDESGYNEARVTVTVSQQLPEPVRPFRLPLPGEVFMSASQRQATINQETLTLTCCARPSAGEQIEWYFNGPSGVLPRRTYVDAQSRLVFNSVLREHAGEYECVHKSAGGSSFATGRLAVRGGQVVAEGMERGCGIAGR